MQLSLVVLSAFFAFSSAHMILDFPPQWKGPPASSPLEPDGSNYPCQGAIPDMYPTANFTAGEAAELRIIGSAAHGGGSGQIAFTLDFPPTKNSVWYVAYSFIGDHPFKVDGNFPADPVMHHPPIQWKVPKNLPSGRLTFAWNWYNKVGNREHYMKCSTVFINSDETDRSCITKLPTAFRANSGNGCIVPENVNGIAFKNPGDYVTTAPGIDPVSIDCDSSHPPGFANPTGYDVPSISTTYSGAQEGNAAGSDKVYQEPSSEPQKESQEYKPECVEGTVTCNPDGTWSQCGSGRNQLQGRVTPGMVCTDGIFHGANVKREIRFSALHRRHRH